MIIKETSTKSSQDNVFVPYGHISHEVKTSLLISKDQEKLVYINFHDPQNRDFVLRRDNILKYWSYINYY